MRIAPDDHEAYLSIGNAYRELRQPDQAIAAFEKAIAVKPDYAIAHFNLGLVLAQQKRLPEARQHLETAARMSPSVASRARQTLRQLGPER